MLIRISGGFIVDSTQFQRRLVVELDCGYRPGDHPECGVFSGRHDGFELPEEMDHRMPDITPEPDDSLRMFDIVAPNRPPPLHQHRRYPYVAIAWNLGGYLEYPVSTEIYLSIHEMWDVALKGVRIILPDYSPWDSGVSQGAQ